MTEATRLCPPPQTCTAPSLSSAACSGSPLPPVTSASLAAKRAPSVSAEAAGAAAVAVLAAAVAVVAVAAAAAAAAAEQWEKDTDSVPLVRGKNKLRQLDR